MPATMPDSTGAVLRSTGQPIPAAVRDRMESSFGHDFSNVRIHSDAAAQSSAADVSARAYTVGDHIVLGSQAPALGGEAGHRLLGHELAHVVQQSRGTGTAAGIDPDPALEEEARRAGDAVANNGPAKTVGTSPLGMARDALPGAPAAGEVMYEVAFPDGKRLITKAEYDALIEKQIRKLRVELIGIKDLANSQREAQRKLLGEYQGGVESLGDVFRKPKSIIGIASDLWGNTTPPWIGIWGWATHSADLGLADLERRDLRNAARHLTMAASDFHDAEKEWLTYIGKTTSGAESLVSDLEIVRDVSFTIALAAGAAVAAPVVAAGVGSLGVTGLGATALTAVGTAGVVGTGGVILGGGSAAIASKVNTGKIDWDAVEHDAKKCGKQGAITGLTAGATQAIFGAGAVAKFGVPFIQQTLRRCAIEAGINVGGEVSSLFLDAVFPTEKAEDVAAAKARQLIPGPVRAAIVGCVSGAIGVPAAKFKGVSGKVVDKVVSAGVAFGDAKLQGMTNAEAALASAQATIVSQAVGMGHDGSHKAAQARAAKKAAKVAGQPGHAESSPQGATKSPATTDSEPPKGASKPSEADTNSHPKAKEQRPAPPPKPDPTINPSEATATKPAANGHDAVVTAKGVGVCSPAPCPVIHIEYKAELDAHPELADWNKRIQAMRQSNPKQAAEEAAALIRTCEAARNNMARARQTGGGAAKDEAEGGAKSGGKKLGKPLPDEHADETIKALDKPDAFKLDVGQERAAKIQSGEKDFPLDQPVTRGDIDEPLAVGAKGISKRSAVKRALDPHNRQFHDPATNRRTKYLGTDPRDIARGRQKLGPVSLHDDPSALFTRRFDETHEMKKIFDEAVDRVKNKGELTPTQLKNRINREISDIIKNGASAEAQTVRSILTSNGFVYREKVGWVATTVQP